jgi:hypothetical protein
MDWMIIGAAVIAGWAMLSVLSGERLTRSQLLEIAQAQVKAAEQARLAAEIPIALSNEAALVGSPAAFNRKR